MVRNARLVLRFVLVEPAGDVQHLRDVVAGTAANAVRLLGHTYENGVDVQELESGVKLFGLGNGRAIVRFAGHNQRWRFHFGDQIRERALHVLIGVVPGITGEPIFGDEGDVGSQGEAVPVDDGIERGGGAEAFGMLDGPASEHPAATAAGDEEIVRVDVALGDDGVNAAVEIVKVVAGG